MDTFYVKGKSYLLPCQKPNPSNHKEYEMYLRPQYEQTHVVQVCAVNGNLCLKCWCKQTEQHGYYCQDFAAVLGTPPDPDDISIRWHKSYYATYLNGDQQLDRIFDNIVEKELPCTRLTSESVADFCADFQLAHVRRSIQKSILNQHFH
jgi:hypothetical protein